MRRDDKRLIEVIVIVALKTISAVFEAESRMHETEDKHPEFREEIKDFIPDGNFKKLLTRMKIGDRLGFTNGNRHYALMRDE